MRKALLAVLLTLPFLLLNPGLAGAYENEIKHLSSLMAADITSAGKKTIAVVDFTDLQGNVTELGRFIAEELSVSLAAQGQDFEVIDRTHLKSIIAEHKLSSTGIIDPQTARKLGQIAGVDALVTGTITPFGDSVRVSAKILDTSTAKILGASSENIAKTSAIEELLSRGIGAGPQAQPASRQSYATPSGPLSKKVGDTTVTLKSIIVSKGQVLVTLDFFNSSDKELRLSRPSRPQPSLADDKGNSFIYGTGLNYEVSCSSSNAHRWQTLYPKMSNDVALYFEPNDRDISPEDMGSAFSFSLNYQLCDLKEKSISSHNVSFTNVSAQKPR